MTISEFRAEICEELDDACKYIKKAMMIKTEYPEWAKRYVDRSAVELSHATESYKMFEDFFDRIIKNFSENEKAAMPWLKETKKEIVELYTDKYTKVKTMHELFNK